MTTPTPTACSAGTDGGHAGLHRHLVVPARQYLPRPSTSLGVNAAASSSATGTTSVLAKPSETPTVPIQFTFGHLVNAAPASAALDETLLSASTASLFEFRQDMSDVFKEVDADEHAVPSLRRCKKLRECLLKYRALKNSTGEDPMWGELDSSRASTGSAAAVAMTELLVRRCRSDTGPSRCHTVSPSDCVRETRDRLLLQLQLSADPGVMSGTRLPRSNSRKSNLRQLLLHYRAISASTSKSEDAVAPEAVLALSRALSSRPSTLLSGSSLLQLELQRRFTTRRLSIH